MSQTKWIRGPICGIDNCRSRLYKRDAGRKFCQFGHIAEGDLDIEDEDGESYTQTKRLNIHFTDTGFGSQASSKATNDASILANLGDKRLYGTDGLVHQYKCFQYILRDVTPKVVRHLYGAFGSTAVESLIAAADPILKLLWVRFVKQTFGNTTPSVSELYILIYLALRQLNRYPVFIDQYIEMVSQNKVPVLNALSLLPPDMRILLPVSSAAVFSPSKVLVEDAFYVLLAKWSTDLDLRNVCATPLDYSYPIVFKLLTDLRIPHAPQLLAVYHELALEITLGVLKQQSLYSILTVPEIQILGLVQYVLHLYLLASPEIFHIQQWIQWIEQDQELPCFRNRNHNMPIDEIVCLSKKQISKYLDWVHENIIPPKYKDPETEELSIMDKKLNKIFEFRSGNEAPTSHILKPPLKLVENDLSASDRARIENHIRNYVCARYGVKSSTLRGVYDRIDGNLRQRLK
ncbi:hypothetical protein METBIDRAFT_9714 [Metschnikowia bicuspidata var. bicuspidata NRRL YB-4993]|uniref:Uncharacterized protein n=1 Tax=Metschnikowia bicuspidata var. bicuspidata NRRL YB-4993 TaxID=869754 RepID=A0A1A0HHG8_9ASCO|nr:hypothetical protein METBIDRAFT_9714 [Metschnikowia bicuspidata var. bicuspidata NRRL YB-4993]OBA23451.1 hypothetical protein METBIDRAFT_9714 [Metschnikowia bicuspidata var. bicuspidata NRRL YB-4993]